MLSRLSLAAMQALSRCQEVLIRITIYSIGYLKIPL
jgi:hypothetical protein